MKDFRNKKQRVKTAKGRRVSSTLWLDRHINDPFVQLAKKQGYRSRAAFKLLEIIEKFEILKGGKISSIVDLGCAPGSWLQVARQKFPQATIVGIDLQEVMPIGGVEIIRGDFLQEEAFVQLGNLCPAKVNLIISDLASDSSGHHETDHLRNMSLVEMALEFCKIHMSEDGIFVAKLIRGGGEPAFIKELQKYFKQVKLFKPKASYKGSTEFYAVALKFL